MNEGAMRPMYTCLPNYSTYTVPNRHALAEQAEVFCQLIYIVVVTLTAGSSRRVLGTITSGWTNPIRPAQNDAETISDRLNRPAQRSLAASRTTEKLATVYVRGLSRRAEMSPNHGPVVRKNNRRVAESTYF